LAAARAARPDADADGDGEALPGFPPAAGLGPVLAPCCPAGGEVAVLAEVPASLCAVFAKNVAIPKAVTTLSRLARKVSLESRRSPESRLPARLRCLMAVLDHHHG
jgi:hypothetical protein